MSFFSPEIVTPFATLMAAIAAIASAVVAGLALKHDRFRERNRALFLKHQFEMEHMQKLIGSFAEVLHLESMEWSDARSRSLEDAVSAIQFHVASLESLGTSISKDVAQWVSRKDSNGWTIPYVIYYELGQIHARTEGKYKEFMSQKMNELTKIQDALFFSVVKG